MTGSLRQTISLSKDQDEGIEYLKKTLGINDSSAHRLLYEYARDNCPDLAERILEKRVIELESELTQTVELLESARQRKKENPESCIAQPLANQNASAEQRIRTPDEIIENYLPDIAKETATGAIARRNIQSVIDANPSKISKIPAECQYLFSRGIRK